MVKKKVANIEINANECCGCEGKCKRNGCGSGVYWVGFIGAAIYYVSTATSFWGGVLGLLKACVWPAFLVFEALKFFGA